MITLHWIATVIGALVMLAGIICGVGRLTIWAYVWAESWWRQRKAPRRERAEEGAPGLRFASDRQAADWLIEDSAGRTRV